MRSRSFALGTAALAGLWLGCSNSTSPAPSIAGTWHVTITSFDSGTVSPSSFDVAITPSGDSFVVSMPTLTWSGGPTGTPVVFNAPPTMVKFPGDTMVAVGEQPFGISNFGVCPSISIGGTANQSRDTIPNALVGIADTLGEVITGTYYCSAARWHGTATMVKTGPASAPAAPAAPAPAGTWHVSIGTMTGGAISPDTFTTTLAASGDSLTQDIPVLSFDANAYDTTFAWANADTLYFLKNRNAAGNTCQQIWFVGRTFGDSTIGTVMVLDSLNPAPWPKCAVTSYGPFTAVK